MFCQKVLEQCVELYAYSENIFYADYAFVNHLFPHKLWTLVFSGLWDCDLYLNSPTPSVSLHISTYVHTRTCTHLHCHIPPPPPLTLTPYFMFLFQAAVYGYKLGKSALILVLLLYIDGYNIYMYNNFEAIYPISTDLRKIAVYRKCAGLEGMACAFFSLGFCRFAAQRR